MLSYKQHRQLIVLIACIILSQLSQVKVPFSIASGLSGFYFKLMIIAIYPFVFFKKRKALNFEIQRFTRLSHYWRWKNVQIAKIVAVDTLVTVLVANLIILLQGGKFNALESLVYLGTWFCLLFLYSQLIVRFNLFFRTSLPCSITFFILNAMSLLFYSAPQYLNPFIGLTVYFTDGKNNFSLQGIMYFTLSLLLVGVIFRLILALKAWRTEL